ncbi:MAG: hypothetical protein WDZ28_05475 [Simkaniaceae bacterium]
MGYEMKPIYIFWIMIIAIFSFFSYSSTTGLSKDEKIVNQITKETAKKLNEKKKLVLIGTGGQMMYKIEMLAMSFNYYQEVDLETARELLVESVEEYLSAINSNQEVRSYLFNYPFTAKNIEITIFFRNPDGSNAASEKINIAAANQGKLIYYIDSPDKHTITAIYRETYEEAKEAISFK